MTRFAGFNLVYGNNELNYFMHRPINDGDEKVLRVEPNVPISFSNGGIVDWPKCARGKILFE